MEVIWGQDTSSYNKIGITSDKRLPDLALIERLRLTSLAVKQPKCPPLYSVSLIRLHGKKVVISTVISEMQAARNLPSTTVSTVTVAQLPCRLDREATRL